MTALSTSCQRKAVLLTAVVWLAASAVLMAQDRYFFGRYDAGIAHVPAGVITADFNGDGRMDVAVANLDETVSVLLGLPDGTLTPKTDYEAGLSPRAIVAGDFNGDGKLDLAVLLAGRPYGVAILPGNGDGTFGPAVETPLSSLPQAMAAGDFNGDGKLDLIVANEEASTVSVLLNNGNGTFQKRDSSVNYPPLSVAVADFNHDGKLDAVVADDATANLISVLPGNGRGGFLPQQDYPTAAGPRSVVAGDFNGDGNPDVAVTDHGTFNVNSDLVSVLLGQPDGKLGTHVDYPSVEAPLGLITADFNGDGKTDLAVTSFIPAPAGNTVTGAVLLGQGNGTFRAPVVFPAVAFGAFFDPIFYIAAGDMNHDGKLDLVMAADSTDTVSVVIGQGDGSFANGDIYTPPGSPYSLASADFNGDGLPDLAVPSYFDTNPSVAIYLGAGQGNFGPPTQYPAKVGGFSVVTADFNLDGNADIAVLGAESQADYISVLLGNGNGSFQAPLVTQAAYSANQIISTDVNGDGVPDLIEAVYFDYGGYGYGVQVLLGNGNGTFQQPKQFNYGTNCCWNLVAGDFNGDHIIDVAAIGLEGTVVVLLGEGNGNFQQSQTFTVSGGAFGIASADFNRDGKLDLAIAGVDAVFVALGNGDGTFATPRGYADKFGTAAMVAADFNNDGNMDVAVVNDTDGITFLFGNGDGSLANPKVYGTGILPAALLAADLDNDGSPDLAVANTGEDTGAGTFTILLNRPVAAFSSSTLSFGQQQVGTKSEPRTATFYNPSYQPLPIKSVSITGDFEKTNTCPSTLQPADSCAFSITFAPQMTGLLDGILQVTDDGASEFQQVMLSGEGTASPR